MNREPGTNEQALQDYLDGRLSPDERVAFEARLEREPGLRHEVESALELRAALGEAGPELSPGFHTRARARFEESTRAQNGWSFRLLSWETAGVAAAAALATALFVPRLMQEGVPTELGPVAEPKNQAIVLDQAQDTEAPPMVRVIPAPQPAKEEVRELARVRDETRAPSAPPEPQMRRSKKSAEAVGVTGREMLESTTGEKSPPRKQTPRPPSSTKRVQASEWDDDALSPAVPTAVDASGKAPSASGHETTAVDFDEPEWQADQGEREKRAAVEQPTSGPVVVELPRGLVGSNRVRRVETLEEWSELLAGSHAAALGMLGEPAPDRRLLLIGARDGLSCDRLLVTENADAYRIGWPAGTGDLQSDGGCALVLPRDGRLIRVDGPR